MASQSKPTVSVQGIIQQALEDAFSPALEASIDTLVLLVSLRSNRLNLNSSNSSKPPASDLNRIKPTRRKTGKKPGGEIGHEGSTLQAL